MPGQSFTGSVAIFIWGDLNEAREVRLIFGGINHRVLVIVKKSEIAVDANVNARRLNHGRVIGVKRDATSVDVRADVAI